jgi:hypothetical protein
MTGKKEKPAQIIDIATGSVQADASRQRKRETKARNLKQRFAAARRASESKSKAAERLKKLFKKPPRNP